MSKRRVILVLVVCLSMMSLTDRTLPQNQSSNKNAYSSDTERQRNISDQEKKREFEKSRRQRKLEHERRRKEQKKESIERGRQMKETREQRGLEIEKLHKEGQKANEEAGGFIFAKYALGATEEQWKLIQAKLEKVRQLREQANSVVGMSLSAGSSNNQTRPNLPTWKWKNPWKGKEHAELTEAQKLAKRLIALVENKGTTPEQFKRTMDALRKARREEVELEIQLSEARQELRQVLTTRQEAALVLMRRL